MVSLSSIAPSFTFARRPTSHERTHDAARIAVKMRARGHSTSVMAHSSAAAGAPRAIPFHRGRRPARTVRGSVGRPPHTTAARTAAISHSAMRFSTFPATSRAMMPDVPARNAKAARPGPWSRHRRAMAAAANPVAAAKAIGAPTAVAHGLDRVTAPKTDPTSGNPERAAICGSTSPRRATLRKLTT